MPEDTGTGNENEGTAEEQAQAASTAEAQAAADRSSPEGDGKGEGELARARKEAAKYRTERNEATKRLEALEAEKLSESEKLAKRVSDAEANAVTLAEENKSLRVQVLAGKAGINPDLVDTVPGLLDWESIEDEKDLEKALKQLVKDRPALAGQTRQGVDQGEGGGEQAASSDMNTLLRRAAGRA